MAIDLNQTGIDPDDPQFQPMLTDLQGNILRGHGRDYSTHLLLAFKPDQLAATRAWISRFATDYVPTARVQHERAVAYRAQAGTPPGPRPGLFANFCLSGRGYRALGFGPFEMPDDRQSRFPFGMKQRQDHLSDPPVAQWEKPFQEEMHALAILASDDRAELERAVAQVQSDLAAGATVLLRQDGERWRNDAGMDIEAFGFVDGISQPLFYKHQIERARQRGIDQWDPSAPLNLVLFQDPRRVHEDSYGSFLVYRKLEQDVNRFNREIDALAAKLGVSPELAAAYAMGRFRDATPVLDQTTPGCPHNNFNFDTDPEGHKCPFHSHIRKSNPRGDTSRHGPTTPEQERNRRIVRRGIPYGNRHAIGTESVGLLFLCFQADLAHQFEFQQHAWSNSESFVKVGTGIDPITGQSQNTLSPQNWPNKWGDQTAGTTPFMLANFVTLKGGEYFCAPSVGFLKQLHQMP